MSGHSSSPLGVCVGGGGGGVCVFARLVATHT